MVAATPTRSGLALSCVIALAACFAPDYQEGLACTESGLCPEGQVCADGVCTTSIEEGRPDGGPDATPKPDALAPADADPGCPPGSETFEFTGSIDSFAIPECVSALTIEVFGAQGGGLVEDATLGGKGARMKGDFAVTGGEVLQILVGERGLDAVVGTFETNPELEQGGGAGGGGSFVVSAADEPIIIAGGGGGATRTVTIPGLAPLTLPGGNGQSVELAQNGGGSNNPGLGGNNGEGGGTHPNAGFHSGTGGGGFLGDGIGNSNGDEANYGTPNQPGTRFLAGGAGGIGGSLGRSGAFGGGGSAGFSGAGGGGYSGGGSADISGATRGGGGGGSINTGNNQDNSPGVQSGNGQIVISW